jgi:hypothetical protein
MFLPAAATATQAVAPLEVGVKITVITGLVGQIGIIDLAAGATLVAIGAGVGVIGAVGVAIGDRRLAIIGVLLAGIVESAPR